MVDHQPLLILRGQDSYRAALADDYNGSPSCGALGSAVVCARPRSIYVRLTSAMRDGYFWSKHRGPSREAYRCSECHGVEVAPPRIGAPVSDEGSCSPYKHKSVFYRLDFVV